MLKLIPAVSGALILTLSLSVSGAAQAQTPAPAPPPAGRPAAKLPSIEDKTASLKKIDGYFPLYWDDTAGTLWMEIPSFGTEVLYVTSLSAGLGSNDIGLDRGQLGGTSIVRFERVGPKILMVQPNYDYRVTTDNPYERRAMEEAFAKSTLWGFTAAAESGGKVLVELTDFLLRDVHGVTARLRPAVYRLERSRSVVNMERTKGFPKNTEMDVTLTFVTDAPGAGPGQQGGRIGDVAPSAEAITLGQHHSIVELPGPGYEPREYDPRSGFFGMTYADYSTPLGQPMVKRFSNRHRLEKKDPRAAVSEAVDPIVYYLDRGTPEPIRSALLDGARWWNQAFEAAGYRNAYRVEVMPEGADMLDVRYNVIQWVHRSTRGWSYGSSVTDPRTGEIIKGHVTLGSLRVRQDYMLAEGLLSPYQNGTETPPELARMALARLRQLSAHEVGHTLGINHQYYNSTGGRISVMDYPHPLVQLRANGTIDLADAYADGIGEWDKVAIRWGYQDFPAGIAPATERAALDKIIADAEAKDLRFMTNQDTDLTPQADQWALGTDMTAELERMMQVRRAALSRFGENAIQRGTPLAMIEETLVPLYLHHRYQVEATASAIGGQRYSYAMRGYGTGDPVKWVGAAEQRAALDLILSTIRPSELALPKALLDRIPPRPSGYGRSRETFPRFTGGAFDPIAPAMVAAQHTLSFMLTPARAARLVAQHAVDPSLPGLRDVLGRVRESIFTAPANPYEAEIARAVQRVAAEQIMSLAASADMPQVRAEAFAALIGLTGGVTGASDPAWQAHQLLLASDIKRFMERPMEPTRVIPIPQPPPGAPIGDPGMLYCDHGDEWLMLGLWRDRF
ncbi:MAG: zinc-dependent metalloprotease [Acidobacteriota bacterium]|nr:zinc-dependent metalloprotease [Acidobacteriota bacterium]